MDRVEPGYNNKQNWGNQPRIKFPPMVEPKRAAPSGIRSHAARAGRTKRACRRHLQS